MKCYNYFDEMRRGIDLHREEGIPKINSISLMKKIDDVCLKMIEQIKVFEASYFKSFDTECENIEKIKEDETQELNETFRDPLLSMDKIKHIQQQREESLASLKIKYEKFSHINNHLKTNQFIPSFSIQTTIFGNLILNKTKNPKSNLYQSKIVNQYCGFNASHKFNLIYRGIRDGFASEKFHFNCNGLIPTLTLLRAKKSKFIFGYFTEAPCSSLFSPRVVKTDPNGFLFSLINRDKKPFKIKIDTNQSQNAIYCDSRFGPQFGYDIHIASNANTTKDSYSNLSYFYKHPQYAFGTKEAKLLLAGSYYFQLSEIEVYQFCD